MTYTTGSGDYVAMMAAVLAHAVTDGWTTTGGNWPINKGVVRGVNWATFTATEADRTLLGGANKTARYLRIAVGQTPALATTAATADATSAQVANMEYTLTSWHIFSDPALCDYIHVVFNFSNGINSDCYGQFSFGELDKHGMAHTGIAYATGSPKRGYSESVASTNLCEDWNGGCYGRTLSAFTGNAGFGYTTAYNGRTALTYIVDPTVAPQPASGWPPIDTIVDGDEIANAIQQHGNSIVNIGPNYRVQNIDFFWSTWAQFTIPQPYSGAISMAPLPFLMLQSISSSAQIMYLGAFPNVRSCAMEGYSPQAIVTYGAEEWMIFPMLRSTPWAQMQSIDVVSSGRSGYAFKKVA